MAVRSCYLLALPGGQHGAEMADFVIDVFGVCDRLRYLVAQQPAVTPAQIVELFFHHRFGDGQLAGEAGI